MAEVDLDEHMRAAAFSKVRSLSELHGHLTTKILQPGFEFEGKRIPLFHPQQGIHKPKEMQYLLSIKTGYPQPGTQPQYEDQRDVYRQIDEGRETVNYAFMGKNPDAAQNRWLRDAYEHKKPIIYFLGFAPRCFLAVFPAFISGWDGAALMANVEFNMPGQDALTPPGDSVVRRYATYEVRQRLHQAAFREAVIKAYGGRCALSGLPEPRLLDAAHIISDKDEEFGQPVISNGLPLSKVHHAAFDAHMIGIDPDYRVHISDRLLIQNDGPMLQALKQLDGSVLRFPIRKQDKPDRDRLAQRFELFKTVA